MLYDPEIYSKVFAFVDNKKNQKLSVNIVVYIACISF